MSTPHQLFAALVVGSLFCGCQTPDSVKRLAIEVHQGAKESQTASEEINNLLLELSQKSLSAIGESYARKLDAEHERLRRHIISEIDRTWLEQHRKELGTIEERFRPQIAETQSRKEQAWLSARGWPSAPTNDLSTAEAVTLHSGLKAVHDEQIGAYRVFLDLVNQQRELAEGKLRSTEETLQAREESLKAVLQLEEEAYESAKRELQNIQSQSTANQQQIEVVLSRLEELDKALVEGTLALRDYTMKKSELALFAGGFLKGFGFSKETVANAESAVESYTSTFSDKLSSKVDAYVAKVTAMVGK